MFKQSQKFTQQFLVQTDKISWSRGFQKVYFRLRLQEEIRPKKIGNMLQGGTVTQQQQNFRTKKKSGPRSLYDSPEKCRPNKKYNMTSRKFEAQQEI
jgi:hypothetical protein